jgi:transcriptional regulator with XRE-family HTH domain
MGDAAISRIETGKIVEPRLATFVRLARALNVSVSELRGEPGQPSADIARISAAWSRATPAERRSIMAAIRRVERDETDETDPDDPDATSS